jgi:hypothetical protein
LYLAAREDGLEGKLPRVQPRLQAPHGFILAPPRGRLLHVRGEGEGVDVGDLETVFHGPSGQRQEPGQHQDPSDECSTFHVCVPSVLVCARHRRRRARTSGGITPGQVLPSHLLGRSATRASGVAPRSPGPRRHLPRYSPFVSSSLRGRSPALVPTRLSSHSSGLLGRGAACTVT